MSLYMPFKCLQLSYNTNHFIVKFCITSEKSREKLSWSKKKSSSTLFAEKEVNTYLRDKSNRKKRIVFVSRLGVDGLTEGEYQG